MWTCLIDHDAPQCQKDQVALPVKPKTQHRQHFAAGTIARCSAKESTSTRRQPQQAQQQTTMSGKMSKLLHNLPFPETTTVAAKPPKKSNAEDRNEAEKSPSTTKVTMEFKFKSRKTVALDTLFDIHSK